MSKVNIAVVALVSLMLANTLALGQGKKTAAGVRENAATSGEHTIEFEQIAQAFHDPSDTNYLRLYCTPDKNSHFQSVTGKLRKTDFAPPAAPLYIGNNVRASTAFFGGFDAGWGAHDLEGRLYHPTPAVQLLIILEGDFSITATDGETRRFRPGDVLRLEDTAPCKGHITVVGDKPGFTMFVR
ncbi:MAG: hypothetical protein ACREE2_00055 [Stellaceae bacterium]